MNTYNLSCPVSTSTLNFSSSFKLVSKYAVQEGQMSGVSFPGTSLDNAPFDTPIQSVQMESLKTQTMITDDN